MLTPGGLLVLGGAPKVGKSDFLISLLAHMAAGVPFLGFTPPQALRVFYLQAEIQYHYLRERMQQIRLDGAVIAGARDNLFATPKLRMILDDKGLALPSHYKCPQTGVVLPVENPSVWVYPEEDLA